MANRRMIASDIWRDDFVCTLGYFERLLWIGMITTCADDQGRIQDRAGFIASDVFPGEMLSFEVIETALVQFELEGKILRYKDGKTGLIQIINWWGYQTPSWAMPSKYPPPSGWTDRIKMHTKDNKVHTENWDIPGGFGGGEPGVHTGVPTPLPTGIEEVESSRGLRVEEGESSSSAEPSGDCGDLITEFTRITGIDYPRGRVAMDDWDTPLTALKKSGATFQDMRTAIKELDDKQLPILSPRSIWKPCMIVMGRKKRKGDAGYIPISADSEFAGVVQR